VRGIDVETVLSLSEHFSAAAPCLAFAYVFRFVATHMYAKGEITLKILLFLDNAMVIGVTV
jgi:hypothetical protein